MHTTRELAWTIFVIAFLALVIAGMLDLELEAVKIVTSMQLGG